MHHVCILYASVMHDIYFIYISGMYQFFMLKTFVQCMGERVYIFSYSTTTLQLRIITVRICFQKDNNKRSSGYDLVIITLLPRINQLIIKYQSAMLLPLCYQFITGLLICYYYINTGLLIKIKQLCGTLYKHHICIIYALYINQIYRIYSSYMYIFMHNISTYLHHIC